MSHTGENPVVVPANVTTQVNGQDVSVKGPKGELSVSIPVPITVKLKDNEIVVNRSDDHHESRSLRGLSRLLTNNMAVGVTEDYITEMKIFSVGYHVAKKGKDPRLSLGYSRPVLTEALEGITFDVDGTIKLSIAGIDKQQVGQLATNIRRLCKNGPYKGRDIHYGGEQIRRKIGGTSR